MTLNLRVNNAQHDYIIHKIMRDDICVHYIEKVNKIFNHITTSKATKPLTHRRVLGVNENKNTLGGSGNPVLNRQQGINHYCSKTVEECDMDDRHTYILLLKRKI